MHYYKFGVEYKLRNKRKEGKKEEEEEERSICVSRYRERLSRKWYLIP
jgi:hypothetical protein